MFNYDCEGLRMLTEILSKEDYESLVSLAEKENRNVADLVEDAIIQYIQQKESEYETRQALMKCKNPNI